MDRKLELLLQDVLVSNVLILAKQMKAGKKNWTSSNMYKEAADLILKETPEILGCLHRIEGIEK